LFLALSILAFLSRVVPCGALEASSWLAEFEAAYECGEVAEYATLLAPEFRFHFGDAENRSRRPDGWNKDEELASYVNLHHGVVREDGTRLPRAVELDVHMAGVREGPDPDHPGSADHRLVFVNAATLSIRFEDGRRVVDTAPHAFHLVRARDRPRRGRGDTWFALKWVERPTDAPALLAALGVEAEGGKSAGEGSGDATQGVVALAGVQATLPPRGLLWPNPVRAGRGVALAFDLIGAAAEVSLEVFDVRGRVLAHVGPVREAAGRRILTWDGRDAAGCSVPAGVYVRARLATAKQDTAWS
jgi:hypothetical protein